VPEITHVLVLSDRPAGSVGEAVQLVIVAPLLLITVGEIFMTLPITPDVPLAPM
jgi:hypothetical protein